MLFQVGDKRDLSDIEMTVMTVQADKVSFEFATEPVAHFRLSQVEIKMHFIVEFPGIVGSPYIDRELLSDADLYTGIRACRCRNNTFVFSATCCPDMLTVNGSSNSSSKENCLYMLFSCFMSVLSLGKRRNEESRRCVML